MILTLVQESLLSHYSIEIYYITSCDQINNTTIREWETQSLLE